MVNERLLVCMPSLLPLNEENHETKASHSIDSGEELSDGIIYAFLSANVQVFDKPTLLNNWVDPVILEAIQRSPDSPHYLHTVIWDHQVVITSEEVRIYTTSKS